MKENTERIRRLERRCTGLTIALIFLFITLIGFAGALWVSSAVDSVKTLSVNWQPDGSLRFSSLSDGPFIIMYLEHGISSEARTAKLPETIVVTDNTGAALSKEKVKQLKWCDAWGKPIAAPKEGAEIKAFYFRPKVAVERK